jgi:hypothetical protein
MGNAASRIAIDSYLDRHACSGRNLTWQYIHNRGALPTPYSNCPYAPAILKSHCCANGVCDPGYFDREFDRYKAFDWDGLGDPGPVGNGTGKVGNGKGEGVNKSLCLGMELVRSTAKTHWPPLGLDGLPMKEFSSVEWVRPLLRNGVYISHGKGEKGKRGSAWNERVEDSAVIWNPTKGSLSREFVEQSLSRGNERLAMWPIVIFSLGICALLVVLVSSLLPGITPACA